MPFYQRLHLWGKPSSCYVAAPSCPACSRSYRVLTTPLSRTNSLSHRYLKNDRSPTQLRNMSFSNTDTGNKPADPYKEKNYSEPDTKTKIEDLIKFIEANKFGMMTTRIASSGLLTSRCMALAAKVCPYISFDPACLT